MTIATFDRARLEDALLDGLPALVAEVRDRLAEHWPDYAAFLDTDRDAVVKPAELFVHRLLDMSIANLINPEQTTLDRGDETVRRVFEEIGRRQLQEGNDLTRLLTAFQLGARVAWRHVAATALRLDFAPDNLAALADSVFVFVNQLSFSAANGYLQEQIEDAMARERRREDLANLLLSGRAGTEAIRTAAQQAAWRIPETAAVVIYSDGDQEPAGALVARLEPGALPIRRNAVVVGAIIPEPSGPGRRLQLSRELAGMGAVVGNSVALAQLPRSLEIARIAVRLRNTGVLTDDPVFADEHLDALIVWRDEALVAALREEMLAPLAGETEAARERLAETLASWLKHFGDRQAIAHELSIHPQTVRYRMARLRALYGDRLDDPESRARLFLALEWPGP
ncbi:PucR family transcriptional regulator [Kribbella sp. NPDC058693]|uniref:PucR family transcriptional regulator n=1 Tax=Kribbella jiaozuonensis TaxID=2575441 RepID=A0A4U3LMU4_9ACTN|nr:helix-turn-helix domain-containing protein [Kribbella jiaozuonensis]TKK76414.1 PucR family transcriptional regulator [Kribbella jiaozuonensis]